MRPSEKITRKPAPMLLAIASVSSSGKSGFQAGGAEASLEAVARAAVWASAPSTGISHARSLFEAVYAAKCNTLRSGRTVATRGAAHRCAPSLDALEREVVATKRACCGARLAADKNSELFSYSFDQLTRAVGGLLDRLSRDTKSETTSARKTSSVPL